MRSREHPVVTIDGPAGAGKSTAARSWPSGSAIRWCHGRDVPALALSVIRAGVPPREGAEFRDHLSPRSTW